MRLFLFACLAGLFALPPAFIAALPKDSVLRTSTAAHAAPDYALSAPVKALLAAPQWLNASPLQEADLRGKVVLVNFWTYSCINSLRALPYIRAWAGKYGDRGLVVIGIHTPEFAFEHDLANVARAKTALDVGYPIVMDNDYGLWRAFANRAWPAFYFIGADGRIRDHRLGEGDYDKSEQLIKRLLSEAAGGPVPGGIVDAMGTGPEAAPDWRDLRTNETYVGYEKAEGFASPGGLRPDAPTVYRTASVSRPGAWSLGGAWTVGSEFATLNAASGSIAFRFHARDLHMVLAPGAQTSPVRFRVKLDGAPPGSEHGFDVDAEGGGSVQDARMYQLIRQTGSVKDRTFEIEFLDPGIRAYVFTFG